VKENTGEVNPNFTNSLLIPQRNGDDSQYLIEDINLKFQYIKPLFSHEGVIVTDDVNYIRFSPQNVTKVAENNSKLSDAVKASSRKLHD
jgi:hypothetical protein